MTSRNAIRRPVPPGSLPDFTPVPRKIARHDGWTPERQRAVIEALADTGCVSIACRMVNMSQPSYYYLRRQPGAESFRAAGDAAQTLGLQPVKDEAFDRAMNGQLVPVFVGGKLLGFRRKKNDRLLMFILRHYGQDPQGRKTTINYFSTRATAGAASNPPRPGEGDHPQGGGGGPETRTMSAGSSAMLRPDCPRQSWNMPGGCSTGASSAKAEASTTTVKTVISGNPGQSDTQSRDTEAANLLNAFEGVPLDAEAQAEIHRALSACAERRRALAEDPATDPERIYVSKSETLAGYAGELESGVEGDWVEYKPEGEHYWEGLGEGGQAAEIDRVLAEIEERKQLPAPPAPPEPVLSGVEGPVLSEAEGPPTEPDPDDPRLDWRNWGENGYVEPTSKPVHPEALLSEVEGPVEGLIAGEAEAGEASISPNPQAPAPKRRKTYKKRKPKPPFTPPDEARKAEAVIAVEAERRELAAAEGVRRRRRNGGTKG